MRDRVRIEVQLRLPWATDSLSMFYELSPDQWRGVLTPLPRDRELYEHSSILAHEQREKRSRLARLLGEMIANAILDKTEEADTKMGYVKGKP